MLLNEKFLSSLVFLPMTASYSIEKYLLDRANIHDTVVRLVHSFDARADLTTMELVYAADVVTGYDTSPENPPQVMTREALASELDRLHAPFESMQHSVLNILIDLPQPTPGINYLAPDLCNVTAYAHAVFYEKDAEGKPSQLVMRNGGKYEFVLTRFEDLEPQGQNPWRITTHLTSMVWMDRPE
ncbi:hypothetical protein AB5N19_14416 [Seiridium cardinale]|uniref:SnoaL-like domain-containing protein n=1 Tax=Seiridium cardinale TaxID=138064 RepID=A0ABR2YA56_9PEZI